MLNIQKYEEELRKYGTNFAVTREGAFLSCDSCEYNDCLLRDDNCSHKRMEWLLQEYKEPLLSLKDKQYLEDTLKYYQDCVANLAIEYHVEADYSVRMLKIKLNIPQILGDKTIKYVTWWLALPILDKSLLEKLDVVREYTLDELELYKG